MVDLIKKDVIDVESTLSEKKRNWLENHFDCF